MKTLEQILSAVQLASGIVSGIGGPAGAFAHIADYFLKIAQAAVKAHESITGQPLDMSKLHEIDPVP